MDKKIAYTNRTYSDYRSALIELSQKYYPTLSSSFDDASVGSWFIDLHAAIADELSFYIDKAFQETNIDSANKRSSVFAIARNNGFKIPGPKGAMAEVIFTCTLPSLGSESDSSLKGPNWYYAPVVKKGTRVSAGAQTFEVIEDINFNEQFNSNGYSDRLIVPVRNSNNVINGYRVSKRAVVIAGETKIYKKYVSTRDIKPFMEVLIPVENVMNVESVVVKPGSNFQSNPTMGEFFSLEEDIDGNNNYRFFEVDSLVQQQRWGEATNEGSAVRYNYGYVDDNADIYPVYSVTKGEWKNVKHKYITEFTDKGYLKVIFGAGYEDGLEQVSGSSDFAKLQMSRMINNNNLGLLPDADSTIFILYRAGGGRSSNVATGAINNIIYKNIEMNGDKDGNGRALDQRIVANVINSFRVESTTPSVSGKDAPTVDEIRYMLKYNSGAQNRCVTVKDYLSRVLLMPPKYGVPFRVGSAEENNKIMLYLLGIDYQGHLDDTLPVPLIDNIKDYLANYRSINDFVEIKAGRIINLSFEIDLFIDKNYNKSDVVSTVISLVRDYMDINKHQMGDHIFVGDLEKEITKIDGVISIIDLRVYNEFGVNYSDTQTTQETVSCNTCDSTEIYQANRVQIDLEASDGVLYSEGDCMFEVKNADDVICRVKER